MPGFTTVITAVGTVTISDTPRANPTTIATNTTAASSMKTYYPLLDVTVPVMSNPATAFVAPTPTEISARDDTKPTIAYKPSETSSADADTVIVDTDSTWEAEYLEAMSQHEKRCGNHTRGDGLTKKCNKLCPQL